MDRVAVMLVAAAIATGVGTECGAATRYDWRLRFGTVRTAHFDIYAHQGEEALARRLAEIVESVRAAMQPTFGVPRGRVHVILVDQTDISNGWANPLPYNAIEITAVPPPAETFIGNSDDWLRVAFTHEYTHILHLDRTRGWMSGFREVFGRAPFVFPNLYLPVWQIEGIATFEESWMTGRGRVHGGDFRVLVDEAARRGRFEPYDRASGGLVDWPGGDAAYAYGAYFHQYLAERYGADQLATLADATAGRLPFFGAPAFRKVFGRSVSALWSDFRESRRAVVPVDSRTDAIARRLTHEGFAVSAPRFGSDGSIYFAAADPHRFPTLEKLAGDGHIRTIANRVLGNRTTVGNGWVVFDQLERARSTAFYSDLYAVRADGGRTHRLTVEARAGDPDLAPDGRRIACVVQKGGGRALAILDFRPDDRTTPTILIDEPETDFTGPRWSPDGRQLVVERRRRGGPSEIVMIDVAARDVRPLVARAGERLITPSWTADGRTVLFAATVGDQPFNIYAVSVEDGAIAQVTDSITGATSPDVSPDGRTLLYVGYGASGYDLFSVPLDAASWSRVDWPAEPPAQRPPAPATTALPGYRPWRSLLPTYWSPTVATDADELLIGAGTSMSDVLGWHTYNVNASWSTARARPDWRASYAYDRWWPTLFASYSDDTDPTALGESRSREVLAGALLPIRHVRWTETGLAAFDFERDSLQCETACPNVQLRRDFGSIRTGWIHDSRRQYGYSISAEEGVEIEAAVESAVTALGSDTAVTSTVIDLRGFQRVIGRHTVLAGRVAFAGSSGELRQRRFFSASGPGPSVPAFDFGRDTIGLMRGVAAEDVVGSRAAVANADLRFPLAYPQRGPDSWPIFLRSIHSAVFFDAGQAWDRSVRLSEFRTSAGAELSVDIVLGHYLPLTVAAGAAWTHDPVAARSSAAIFGRVGRAF
jgi:Tol biopolymer transport system component